MTEDRPVPASLAWITLRRSITQGSRFLLLGTAFSLLLALVLIRNPAVFAVTYPLEVPLFATLGSMGAILVFSKGVFEYLISYGIPPERLFGYGLLSAASLASVVLGAALVVGVGGFVSSGGLLTWALEESILFYSIPMTFACALFATIVSMVWSTISSPRAGMNSPIGYAPMLGIGPAVLVLVAAESAPRADYYYVTTGAAVAILALVVVLALASGRFLNRERLLSPM
jgi:hypothetical protein